MLTLYDYQLDYLRAVKSNWLYDCDTGVGKTVMGLAHYRLYFTDSPLCIIAPASKIKEGGWQRTLEKMCPNRDFKIYSYNILPRKINELAGHFIIFDECHKIKNSTGVWGKAAYNVCKKSAGFILLSATPQANGWGDVINYFKIFGLTKNKTQFLKRFAVISMQYGHQDIVGWRNTKHLKSEYQTISRRLNKEDCHDLPPLVFKDVFFTPSSQYKTLWRTRLLDGIAYDNSMSLRHGLRQNCAVVSKLDYLNEILEGTEQNVVIFYNYHSELVELRKNITSKTIYECNGAIKNYPQGDQTDLRNSVTLANYKSGSEGVEFTYANIIIFFSPTESYTEFYQSYGRCHRNKQKHKVTCYKFITKNTIEVDIYESLSAQRDFSYDLWEAKYA